MFHVVFVLESEGQTVNDGDQVVIWRPKGEIISVFKDVNFLKTPI